MIEETFFLFAQKSKISVELFDVVFGASIKIVFGQKLFSTSPIEEAKVVDRLNIKWMRIFQKLFNDFDTSLMKLDSFLIIADTVIKRSQSRFYFGIQYMFFVRFGQLIYLLQYFFVNAISLAKLFGDVVINSNSRFGKCRFQMFRTIKFYESFVSRKSVWFGILNKT